MRSKLKDKDKKEHQNKNVRAFLKARDLFNLAKFCRKIKYNRGTFYHFEEGLDIGEEIISKCEEVLKDYGYNKNKIYYEQETS